MTETRGLRLTRVCVVCGVTFEPPHNRRICCGEECSRRRGVEMAQGRGRAVPANVALDWPTVETAMRSLLDDDQRLINMMDSNTMPERCEQVRVWLTAEAYTAHRGPDCRTAGDQLAATRAALAEPVMPKQPTRSVRRAVTGDLDEAWAPRHDRRTEP